MNLIHHLVDCGNAMVARSPSTCGRSGLMSRRDIYMITDIRMGYSRSWRFEVDETSYGQREYQERVPHD